MPEPGSRLGSSAGRAYFASQALAGAAWWVAVFASDPIRRATLGGLDAVVVATLDVPLFVIASALAAIGMRWAVWVAAPWAGIVAALMALYATATQQAGWGAVLMLAAAACSIVAGALVLVGRIPGEWLLVGPLAIRTARQASTARHLGSTGAQIAVFWGLFLVVLPLGIAWLEDRWRLRLEPPPSAAAAILWCGLVLLLAASALGIWSGATMAARGAGTPLPSATANLLVVSGPYRFVRNPMAVAGVAQGVAVGLVLGSWLVVVYALCGSLVWNWAIRPHEEADLEARFGAGFAAYRRRVPCWVPRLGRGPLAARRRRPRRHRAGRARQ